MQWPHTRLSLCWLIYKFFDNMITQTHNCVREVAWIPIFLLLLKLNAPSQLDNAAMQRAWLSDELKSHPSIASTLPLNRPPPLPNNPPYPPISNLPYLLYNFSRVLLFLACLISDYHFLLSLCHRRHKSTAWLIVHNARYNKISFFQLSYFLWWDTRYVQCTV